MSIAARSIFILFVCLLALIATTYAQDTNGSIEGTVVDKSGLALTDATVTVTSLTTGLTYNQKTDASGAFAFLSVPVGDYRVAVAIQDFAPWSEPSLHLNVGQKLRLPITLDVAGTAVTVDVTGSAEIVQTSSVVLGSVITGKEVSDLPLNGRTFSQLGLLQPGVRPMTAGLTEQGGSRRSGHAYSINGQRPESNNFLVDGTRTVNRIDGGFVFKQPMDSIVEFKILTHTAPAEYGGTSGGITTIVTRSGATSYTAHCTSSSATMSSMPRTTSR
jgi:hypothetical protein